MYLLMLFDHKNFIFPRIVSNSTPLFIVTLQELPPVILHQELHIFKDL